MYREDGKLAARGRHVKYLPMGRAWDLSATPLLFPVLRKLSERRHQQWLRDPERTKVRKQNPPDNRTGQYRGGKGIHCVESARRVLVCCTWVTFGCLGFTRGFGTQAPVDFTFSTAYPFSQREVRACCGTVVLQSPR